MRTLTTITLLLTSLLAACGGPAARKASAIPADFKIKATRYLETTGIKQTLKINAKGEAILETEQDGEVTPMRLSKIKSSDLRQIVEMTRRVKFFALHPAYSGALTDHQFHTIELTMNGETHKVEVEALRQMIRESNDVQRFAKVWLTIVAATPRDEINFN